MPQRILKNNPDTNPLFDDAATFTMAYPEEAAKSIQNVADFKYDVAIASMKYNGQRSL